MQLALTYTLGPRSVTLTAESLDDLDDALEAMACVETRLIARYGVPSTVASNAAPREPTVKLPSQAPTLNAQGQAMVNYLKEHPEASPTDVMKQETTPKNAERTIRWLMKHHFVSFDASAQRYQVLKTA